MERVEMNKVRRLVIALLAWGMAALILQIYLVNGYGYNPDIVVKNIAFGSGAFGTAFAGASLLAEHELALPLFWGLVGITIGIFVPLLVCLLFIVFCAVWIGWLISGDKEYHLPFLPAFLASGFAMLAATLPAKFFLIGQDENVFVPLFALVVFSIVAVVCAYGHPATPAPAKPGKGDASGAR